MDKRTKHGSREVRLELAVIGGKYLLNLEHLHYGYWTDDLELNIANLHKAQENYTDFLFSGSGRCSRFSLGFVKAPILSAQPCPL